MGLLIGIIGVMLGVFVLLIATILISDNFISYGKKNILGCIQQLRYQFEKSKTIILIPLITCFISICIYHQHGISIEFFKFLFFMFMMVLIGYIDFKTTYVYRITTLITLIGGLAIIILESWILGRFPMDNLLGALIGFIVIGLIVLITRGMGEGDIEIAALCGLFLGVVGSILTLFLGIVFGGIGGAILLARQAKGLKDEMAFGPYLMVGAMISMLWGARIFEMYLTLF